MRGRGWPMLVAAARRRDGVLLDLAVDVLLPPLSTLVLVVALGAGASCLVAGIGTGWAVRTDLAVWASCGACLLIYLIRGWQLSGTGLRGLLSFLHVPGYILWKLVLILRRDRGRGSWVRTAREGGPGGPVPS
jgi:1,2-diacylglycerol 3-beta-glucosyltransferase